MQTPKPTHIAPRSVMALLIPLLVAIWYFLDKIGSDHLLLKALIVFAAIAIQLGQMFYANALRKRHTYFMGTWRAISFLTGDGNLPLRLFLAALLVIVVLAIGMEISGFQSPSGIPQSFISRYVEVDLYWTFLSFMGSGDSSITPLGASKLFTSLSTFCGLIFWTIFISMTLYKFQRYQSLLRGEIRPEEFDSELAKIVHASGRPLAESNASSQSEVSGRAIEGTRIDRKIRKLEQRISRVENGRLAPKLPTSKAKTVKKSKA